MMNLSFISNGKDGGGNMVRVTQYNETTEYMFETKKDYFLRYFKDRQIDNNKMMMITVRTPDSISDELIINLECNIDKKLEYYNEAYDDNLKLKTNPDVKITQYVYGHLGSIPVMERV